MQARHVVLSHVAGDAVRLVGRKHLRVLEGVPLRDGVRRCRPAMHPAAVAQPIQILDLY